MKQGRPLTREQAEGLAIQALTFIAGDGERLGRFLAITGIGPAEIRSASRMSIAMPFTRPSRNVTTRRLLTNR
ncbi:MAG TPA: DUF3572 family protein [Pseudolabrys sp.]|nr:DUF3572 family protein [Pseudolabrys sp.]